MWEIIKQMLADWVKKRDRLDKLQHFYLFVAGKLGDCWLSQFLSSTTRQQHPNRHQIQRASFWG